MNKDELTRLYMEMDYEFKTRVEANEKIQRIGRKVEKKTATYLDMNALSVEVGTDLSKTLTAAITPEVFPIISEAEANATVLPMLEEAYDAIRGPVAATTKAMNEKAGIGLNAVEPPFNTDRATGICKKLASYESLADGVWMLGEPIINFSQNVVDEFVEENASAQFKAGTSPKIVRIADGGACKWCRALEGTYNYPEDVPNDVYRRHEDCRCTVEFFPDGSKHRQSVWSKKWSDQREVEKRERVQKVEKATPKMEKKDPAQIERQAEAMKAGKPVEQPKATTREFDDLDRLTVERLETRFIKMGKTPEEARRLAGMSAKRADDDFLKLKESVRQTEEAKQSLIQTYLDKGVAKNRAEAEAMADAVDAAARR